MRATKRREADQHDADAGTDDAHLAAGATPTTGGLAALRQWWLPLLVRAAHPGLALLTAAGLAGLALLAGRPAREALVVLATVLVGQAMLGWFRDLVDRDRDERRQSGRPLASGHLEPGTVWFALACAALLVVPLSISTGVTAGLSYLAALVVALAGHRLLRRGAFSWVPWAASYALFPAYLSYGGWGGDALGPAPGIGITVLGALLGVGVHVLVSVYGLVADHEEGWRSLPVRLGLRLGAGRLLRLASAATLALLVAVVLLAGNGGLGR